MRRRASWNNCSNVRVSRLMSGSGISAHAFFDVEREDHVEQLVGRADLIVDRHPDLAWRARLLLDADAGDADARFGLDERLADLRREVAAAQRAVRLEDEIVRTAAEHRTHHPFPDRGR